MLSKKSASLIAQLHAKNALLGLNMAVTVETPFNKIAGKTETRVMIDIGERNIHQAETEIYKFLLTHAHREPKYIDPVKLKEYVKIPKK